MTERSIAAKTRTRQSTLTNQPKMARRPALLLAALTHRSSTAKATAIAAFVVQLSLPAAAQDGPTRPAPASASATRPPPTGAEFARLEAQVNEQRQLIIQLMRNERQRCDILLRLGAGPGTTAATLPPQSPAPDLAGAAAPAPAPAPAAMRRFGSVDGKVSIPGGDLNDAYV